MSKTFTHAPQKREGKRVVFEWINMKANKQIKAEPLNPSPSPPTIIHPSTRPYHPLLSFAHSPAPAYFGLTDNLSRSHNPQGAMRKGREGA